MKIRPKTKDQVRSVAKPPRRGRPKTRSSYEGLQGDIKKLKAPPIEVWKNRYPEKDYVIRIEVPEFTCLCPKTHLPDFAHISIKYIPDKWCLELKSLKYYELFYRDLGIFHENVVNRFLDDIVRSARPRWAEVTGEFNARGGIKTTVSAEYPHRTRMMGTLLSRSGDTSQQRSLL